ncbi:hypothetical protein GGR56DRAFT_221882 [Xylariaceae sp. FL0804]|nr:hypothetical protein GGR56DRAFT_221882 [Xylariaceae sp. FL0804]
MPTSKPKLAQLTTPVTATFPSELSALSARTPLSAVPSFIKEEFPAGERTPISPPTAYMDFLKSMSVQSPVAPEKKSGSGTSTPEEESEPSTASSEQTDCSCKCGNHAAKSPLVSPYPGMPMSAPPTGAAPTSSPFPGLQVPVSPAMSSATAALDSPLSARSPFSARSVRSPFDWETALKSRSAQEGRAQKPTSAPKSVRHIREVVTRTVTYTPRMAPAPKGKRRRTRSSCTKVEAPVTTVAEVPPPTIRSNTA